MPEELKTVRVFMASPSDLAQERQVFVDVVNQFNKGFAEGARTRNEALRWEALPASYGPRPQDVINGLIDQCDVFVLTLHRRWGQEAKGAGFSSYTEEEFRRAEALYQHNGRPRILVFLKRIAREFLDDPGAQLVKVLKFREELRDSGKILYREFETPSEFATELEDHLKKCIRGELADPSQTTVLPQQVVDALKQGLTVAVQAKAEMERVKKSVDDLQRFSAEFMKKLATALEEATGTKLPFANKESLDIFQEARERVDQALEESKASIKAAWQVARNPDVQAFLKAFEAIILLVPPRPVGFDPLTLRNMEQMLKDFNLVCAAALNGPPNQTVVDASRYMFESAIKYERSKAQIPSSGAEAEKSPAQPSSPSESSGALG